MKVRNHWTISALKDFETCPAKYRWSYLFEAADWLALGYKLVPSRDTAAMDRGTEVHQTCENYLLGTGELHREISPAWAHLIDGLRYMDAVAEEMWEFAEGWHPIMADDPAQVAQTPMWLRMKIDAHYFPTSNVLHVIDYKTGKPYPANMEQVEVYAIGGFAKFDDVDTIVGELWYFDSDEPHEKAFHRKNVSKLARKWEQRADALLSAVQYPAKLNKFCNWCPYSRAKGGPCPAA